MKNNILRIDKKNSSINFATQQDNFLYRNNRKILEHEDETIIIGWINVKVNVDDAESGINKVEFYVDDELKETISTYPYNWMWDEHILLGHTLKTIVYDNAGNTATDEINVWIFNFW